MPAIVSSSFEFANLRSVVDKPRGLENAALQHERHGAHKPNQAESAAAVVSLGESSEENLTYRRDGRLGHANAQERQLEESAARLVSDEGTQDANVHINSRGSGSGTLVVGEDAKVHINSRGDGSGTLIVGEGADVHINSRGEGSGTLMVAENEKPPSTSANSSATLSRAEYYVDEGLRRFERIENQPSKRDAPRYLDPRQQIRAQLIELIADSGGAKEAKEAKQVKEAKEAEQAQRNEHAQGGRETNPGREIASAAQSVRARVKIDTYG